MQLILTAAEAIGLIVGSLAAAALLCWLLWHGFRLLFHPEWAAPVLLILVVFAVAGALPSSQFLGMTWMFAAIAAVPLWIAGRAWRKQRRPDGDGRRGQAGALPPGRSVAPTRPASRLYPAITACIGEDRPPTREEIHTLAARLWREGFASPFDPQADPASFALRRRLVRTAEAILRGSVHP